MKWHITQITLDKSKGSKNDIVERHAKQPTGTKSMPQQPPISHSSENKGIEALKCALKAITIAKSTK
jgi:hypothetical protein